MDGSALEKSGLVREDEDVYEGQWISGLPNDRLSAIWSVLRTREVEDECKLMVEIEMYARGLPT